MRRVVIILSMTCVVLWLCGCSPEKVAKLGKWGAWIPVREDTVPVQEALESALRSSTLFEGNQPYHLLLEITPPLGGPAEMRAEVEIYWLNQRTYRTVIRSARLNQTRIVNGGVVEEHDSGEKGAAVFYPRWLENFVDALLEPVPDLERFRKLTGRVPVGAQARPCLTVAAEDSTPMDAQICLQVGEPRLGSFQDFRRYIAFDNFAPFGGVQVPRRVINELPGHVLLEGRVVALEPLQPGDYGLVKATQYTGPEEKIVTVLVPEESALAQLEWNRRQAWPPVRKTGAGAASETAVHLYVRTDRTGQVREAYTDPGDHYGLQNGALRQALQLKFKPLVVDGQARQMETVLTLQ